MSQPSRKRGPRFGLGMLLLITTLLAVAAAAGGGLRRGPESRVFFVLFTLVTPVLVLMLASLWQFVRRRK